MSCPMKVNNNTIELTVHTSCYCILLCVSLLIWEPSLMDREPTINVYKKRAYVPKEIG